jgi:predicted phage tail protein
MRRRVYLHGALKKLHDGPIEVVATTVAEAVKLISLQLPGFRPNAIEGRKRIQVAGCETIESLFDSNNQLEELHFFPQLNGGKSGGFLQILVGAALVAASFILPVGPLFAGILLKVGAMVVLGGVLQLFSVPARDATGPTGTVGEANRSHYLGAPQNTIGIGERIPILYGRRKVGGQLLSTNITAV